MEKNLILFLLIILVCFACEKQQRNDNIVLMHNFSMPENLSFRLEGQTLLADSIFDSNIPDSSKMQRLDHGITIQILQLSNKVFDHDAVDTISPIYYENTSCYVYGKLNLQPSVESIVIWEFNRDTIFSNFRKLWLFNMKDNKLCSIMLLDFKPDVWIDDPPFDSKAYFKNKCFIFRAKKIDDVSFWVNLKEWLRGKKNNMTNYFSICKVDERGFIEFVEKFEK